MATRLDAEHSWYESYANELRKSLREEFPNPSLWARIDKVFNPWLADLDSRSVGPVRSDFSPPGPPYISYLDNSLTRTYARKNFSKIHKTEEGSPEGNQIPRKPTLRERGLSPRQRGTNPRALGTNPRALGTNPKSQRALDPDWFPIVLDEGLRITHVRKGQLRTKDRTSIEKVMRERIALLRAEGIDDDRIRTLLVETAKVSMRTEKKLRDGIFVRRLSYLWGAGFSVLLSLVESPNHKGDYEPTEGWEKRSLRRLEGEAVILGDDWLNES